MNLIFFSLLANVTQDIPGLVVREPRPPIESHLVYEASCGATRIRIEDYGYVRPEEASPRILVNGRHITGERASALERDLADPRAAYRLSSRCTQPDGHLQLQVHYGRRVRGEVEFRVSGATFVN